MIRETLSSGSTNAATDYYSNVGNYIYFTDRASTGGNTTMQSLSSVNLPYWVKLVRSGSTFSGYASVDGVNWTQVGTSQTITMAQNVYIGLAATSNNNSTTETATFDNVSVSSAVSPAPVITGLSATSGTIGSQLVISGSAFGATQNGSIVTLNGAAVTINSWGAGSITITIPAGATSGPLLVSVAPSMNDSNYVNFTVTLHPLPQTWLDQDIGSVGTVGSATFANGIFTVTSAGRGITSTADGFHFVYQPLSGDGTIVARVVSITGGSYPQAGVMIRETLSPGSTNAATDYYSNVGNYIYFTDRASMGGNTTMQSLSSVNLPYWVKLVRSGSTFSGYASVDGVNWTQVGTSQTITMAQNTYIGLAVSSNSNNATTETATFDNVSVSSGVSPAPAITSLSATTGTIGNQVVITGSHFGSSQGNGIVLLSDAPMTVNSWSDTSITITISSGAISGYLSVLASPTMNSSNPVVYTVTSQPLPVGWLDTDIGTVGLTGSATYSNGTFTVKGAGQGMYGAGEGLHFVYQPLSGDGVIIARVNNIPGEVSSTEVGVMIRETLNTGASSMSVWYYPNQGYLSVRSTTGGTASLSNSSFSTGSYVPYWVKLARTGATISAYCSADGNTWTQIGTSQTINMAQAVDFGLAVSSASTGILITATLDNVSIKPGTMPMVSGVTPSSGTIGTSVTITGSGFGSSQGTSVVNFGGAPATSITTWTNTQIIASVPANASTGPVTVVANSIQSNTNYGFTFYNPVISSLSPPAGQVGATVIVNGSGFGPYQLSGFNLWFNGVAGEVTSWTDTSLTAFVPTLATSGPVTVTQNGVTSNAVQFSVENLSVTGISPNSGPVGTPVTITGTGFGSTQTNSTVDFYGTSAAVQSWSDTQIVAIVPSGAPSGSVDVTVGSVVWYGPQFTMTRTIQLTDSNSNQSSYTSALIGGQWRTLVGQGSGCSTCTQRGNISYTYDSAGNVLSRTDENGHTTTYTYDSNGNVLTVTVPISSGNTATTTYTYNSFGEVLTITDPLGNVTTNSYDANGNLLSVTTPAPGNGPSASVTQFAYNSLGELTKITDPLNNQTTIAYFPTGLIQTITDAQSNVTTYAYDSRGNRTSVTDANNKQTTFTYDAMNRLTKITYPDTTFTQLGYDIRGRRTSVTDQNNKTTNYAYDDADRLITVTDAATNVTTYGYDTESNLTSIQDANHNTTTFYYDAFGRVTQTTFPSGYTEMYGYDNVGNLTSKTDRKNQQITYTYDQLNRLIQKAYPDTTAVSYIYDNDSRLTQVTDPTGTYQFTFDNMGRLTGTTTQYAFLAGRNFTTGYGYDAASNRASFIDPEGGSSSYVYDTLNRLQTLTPPAAISGGNFGFGYDALSRRTSLTRPNTVNTTYSYDNLSHLLSVTHAKGGVTLDGASYTVDNAGNRNSKSDFYAGVTTNYGYDAIYELLNATQAGTTKESYTYDPVGNRLSNLTSSGWNYNTSNELNSHPTMSYNYDYNGNTILKTDSTGSTSYTWDYENRMTSTVLPGSGGTVSFKYDPFGRRIYKSSSSGTSIYAYDGDNLVEETNAAGAVVARYSQGLNIDEPLAMLRSGTTSYYQADGLGSLTSLSNTSGALANTYTYDSFGNLAASTGSLTNSFRYTGREFDTETSLYYYRARYYDPATGRFLSEDPIQFDGGFNFYAYADNEPPLFIDPFGLQNQTPAAVPPVPPVPHPGTPAFIAGTASGFYGSTYWRSTWYGGMHGEVRPFANKCNIFVGDVLDMNGIGLPKMHSKGEYPLAEDWGNPKIPQIGPFVIVNGQPQPGDIISDGHHVGIVVGYHQTASTNAFKGGVVDVNDWGFRPGQHPVIRRCTSCQK